MVKRTQQAFGLVKRRYRASRYPTKFALLVCVVCLLVGCGEQPLRPLVPLLELACTLGDCGEETVRPFIEKEFDIQRIIYSNWILFHSDCAAYQVEPKPSGYFTQRGPWAWQPLPMSDEVEHNGMGLKTRTLGGMHDCLMANKKLFDKITEARIGRRSGYYRFYQTDVLAFYLPETSTLVVGYEDF